MRWTFDDGGRKDAGYKGNAGDCACRAVSIATGKPYQEVYDALNAIGANERSSKRRRGQSNARTGFHGSTLRKYLLGLGYHWTPTMRIGQGCTTHLCDGELPMGRLIAFVSKHYVAVIDGVIHDTFDPSRAGRRCVYGYFTVAP